MKDYRIYTRSSGSYTITVDGSKPESDIVCPICSPNRKPDHRSDKKLNVNISKEVWRCNHCGEGGRLYDKDEREIRMEMIRQRGLTPLKKKTTDFSPMNDSLIKWVMEVRKISEKALYALKWRQSRANFRVGDKFEERDALAFMVYIDGTLINVHYRDKDKNFTREKAADTVPYNWDSIKGRKVVYLVEGEIDVGAILSIEDIEKGWINKIGCASVPNGSTVTAAEKEEYEKTGNITVEKQLKLEWLNKLYNDLDGVENVVICTDDDATGIKLRKELARRIGIERCSYVSFAHRELSNGKRCKDADDVLIHFGVEALYEDLKNAKNFPSPNVVSDEEASEEIDDFYENGLPMGQSVGYNVLDKHFTLQKGHPICFYGWPGHGKTTVVLNIMVNMTTLYGWNWGLYCPENYPPKLLYATLIEIYTGKSFQRSERNTPLTKDEYIKAKKFIINHFKIVDNLAGFSVKALITEMEILRRRYDIDGFLIDPWNSLNDATHDIERMNQQLNSLIRWGLFNKVCVIFSVHPSTPDKKVDSSVKPNVFQLEGGLIWNKKMYSMVCIHQPLKHDITDCTLHFDVTKNKWHKTMGIPTSVTGNPIEMKVNRSNNRLLDLDGNTPLTPGAKGVRTRSDNRQLKMEMENAEAEAGGASNNDWV